MASAKYIGNIKSKEFHKTDCFVLRNMYNINQRPFYSKQDAIREGYDPCGHCLGVKKENRKAVGVGEYYVAHFYGVFGEWSTDTSSGIIVERGDTINVFVKLNKLVFLNSEWKLLPVSNHEIDISCDFINFPSQKTNSNGLAKWNYTIPQNFEPGYTSMRANLHIKNNLIWDKSYGSLSFEVPKQIEIIKNIPKDFDQETKIVFKLTANKRIKADIYRGSSENKFSHIKTIRELNDGIVQKSDKAFLVWDGKNSKGKYVIRGKYKVVIRVEDQISNRDELLLNKKKGILGGTDPNPNKPNEYVSDIKFSRNPFSAKTKVNLSFTLKKNAKVSIHVQHINWNFVDKCVKEIIKNNYLEKGNHSFTWDGKNNINFPASLGKYKVRITTDNKHFVKKGLWKKANWNL